MLDIVRLGAQGDGIAERDDGLIYVPETVPGDVVDADVTIAPKGGGVGNVRSLIREGPSRVTPVCRHFGDCGGCKLQMLDPALYQTWAEDRIVSVLSQHGLRAYTLKPIVVSRPATRRRLALKALRTASHVVLGLSRQKSHDIVELEMCPVTRPQLTSLFDPLRSLLATLLPVRGTAKVHLTDTDTGLDLVLEGNVPLGVAEREALSAFALTHNIAAVHVMQDGFYDPVLLRRHPVMRFGGVAVDLPPAGFIQATAEGEEALTKVICAEREEGGRALDLFAGMGTFSLPLARTMPVHAVEGAKTPLDSLSRAARRSGGHPVITEHRDLFRRPLHGRELAPYHLAVFDPPRAGAEAQAAHLAVSDIPTLVAVSCNPNTFARDAALLIGGGYALDYVQPVGQFLWSSHIELAAVFRKGDTGTAGS